MSVAVKCKKDTIKGTLYSVDQNQSYKVEEYHSDDKSIDRMIITYDLNDNELGLYAKEYKIPDQELKKPDLLYGIQDKENHTISLGVVDIKRNIMSFYKNGVVNETIAFKMVTNFVDQMNDGKIAMEYIKEHEHCLLLHMKFSLCTRYWNEAFIDKLIENIKSQNKTSSLNRSINKKAKIRRIRNENKINLMQFFKDKKIVIEKVVYPLHILLLDEVEKDCFSYHLEVNNHTI